MTQLNLWAQRAVDACMSKVKIPENKKEAVWPLLLAICDFL